MLLYDCFTIALRYSVKQAFSQFARDCTSTVGKLLFPQSEEGWAFCTSNIIQTLGFYSRLPGLNRHWLDLVHPLSENYFFDSRNEVGPIVSQHCTNVGNQKSISYMGPTFNRSSQSAECHDFCLGIHFLA